MKPSSTQPSQSAHGPASPKHTHPRAHSSLHTLLRKVLGGETSHFPLPHVTSLRRPKSSPSHQHVFGTSGADHGPGSWGTAWLCERWFDVISWGNGQRSLHGTVTRQVSNLARCLTALFSPHLQKHNTGEQAAVGPRRSQAGMPREGPGPRNGRCPFRKFRA